MSTYPFPLRQLYREAVRAKSLLVHPLRSSPSSRRVSATAPRPAALAGTRLPPTECSPACYKEKHLQQVPEEERKHYRPNQLPPYRCSGSRDNRKKHALHHHPLSRLCRLFGNNHHCSGSDHRKGGGESLCLTNPYMLVRAHFKINHCSP